MHFILSFALLALSSAYLHAKERREANPGDWHSSPYGFSSNYEDGKVHITIRNLDSFTKNCQLQIGNQRQGSLELILDQTLLFKPNRSLEIPVASIEQFSTDSLKINMGCLPSNEIEKPETNPPLDTNVCSITAPDCQQLCPAAISNPESCENNHVLIDFERKSFKVITNDDHISYFAEFKSAAEETLNCQFLTVAKGVSHGTGDRVYLQLSSEPRVISPGERYLIEWKFSRDELGAIDEIDSSRPRIVGTCTRNLNKQSPDFYSSCDPLKRPECNWVLAQ